MGRLSVILGSLAAAAMTVLAACGGGDEIPDKPSHPLLTEDLRQVDQVALSLRNDAAVLAIRETVAAKWASSSAGQTDDGKAQLNRALDEAIYLALRATAANDPSKPKIIWDFAPAYTHGNLQVPGSRTFGDLSDRIYRSFAATSSYQYEIRGKRHVQASDAVFSFESLNSVTPAGQPLAMLTSDSIDIAGDGTFAISADSTPANGRRNHLYLPPGTSSVLIRDTLVDWGNQMPNYLSVKRMGGSDLNVRSAEVLSQQAVDAVTQTLNISFGLANNSWFTSVNKIEPAVRNLSSGVQGAVANLNRFSLKGGEALVLTIDPSSAKYLSLQLTDSWGRSVPYWKQSSSLNNRQAKANSDGTYTFVVSPTDPGYYNWADTGGLKDGMMFLRLESLTQAPVVKNIVRYSAVVNLSQLKEVIPDAALSTPDERSQLLAQRYADFSKRVVP